VWREIGRKLHESARRGELGCWLTLLVVPVALIVPAVFHSYVVKPFQAMLYWLVMASVGFASIFMLGCLIRDFRAVEDMSRWRRVVSLIGAVLCCGGFLNYLVWWAICISIGGDASLGKVEDGKYFLGSHGRYTEVSESTFVYSQWHTRSAWLSLALTLPGGFLSWCVKPNREVSEPSAPPASGGHVV
jgi:hypothetical protein